MNMKLRERIDNSILLKSLIVTLLSVVISVAITILAFRMINKTEIPLLSGVTVAMLAPLLITPIITIHLLTLVKELKETKTLLEDNLRTDFLTNIHNRKHIVEFLEREYLVMQRYRYDASIILIDIDFFKQINDKHGHLAGDHILKEFSQILNSSIRQTDVLGRYGGEEFLIVCTHTNSEQAAILATRLKEQVERYPFIFDNKELRITASFGIASNNHNSNKIKTMDYLLKNADIALYEAKHSGRNCVRIHRYPEDIK